jgi:tetratricopeptide (TPR) repeat protein
MSNRRFARGLACGLILIALPAGDRGCTLRAEEPAARRLLTAEQVYQQTLKSTAFLVAGNHQGSGWVLQDGDKKLLVTNEHVVASAQHGDKFERVFVDFPSYKNGDLITERAHHFTRYQKQPPNGRVLVADARRDLAVVEIEGTGGPALRLARHSVQRGDQVHILGNPGDGPMWKHITGRVLDLTRNGSIHEIRLATPLFVKGGTSGGPIVNDYGELVGVIAAVHRNGPELAYAIELLEVLDFLADGLSNQANPHSPLTDPVRHWTYELRRHPKDGSLYRQRATALLRQGQYDAAIADCTQALYLNPDDALACNERGAAWTFKDRDDAAIADFTQALKLDPRLTAAYRNRAGCHFRNQDFEAAAADCSRAIELDAKDARAYWRRSQAYEKLNQVASAAKDRKAALALNPALK